jgi:hypothetical protein
LNASSGTTVPFWVLLVLFILGFCKGAVWLWRLPLRPGALRIGTGPADDFTGGSQLSQDICRLKTGQAKSDSEPARRNSDAGGLQICPIKRQASAQLALSAGFRKVRRNVVACYLLLPVGCKSAVFSFIISWKPSFAIIMSNIMAALVESATRDCLSWFMLSGSSITI